MRTLAEGFTETIHLIADTFRLWWRNLLPMLSWYLAGYVGFRASIGAAIWLAAHQHQSLGVGIFSAGVLIQIAATVGMIRTCAGSLHRWRTAARKSPEETTDPTEKDLLELLSVTMLPLVAVWSAWGFLEERVGELSVSNLVERGTGPGSGFFQLVGGAGRPTCRPSASCWCYAGWSRPSTIGGRAGRPSSSRSGRRPSSCS
jgi:hypothetical protein